MRTRCNSIRFACLGLTLLLLAGCAAGSGGPAALRRNSLDKMDAAQEPSRASLEKHGDEMAASGQWMAALFEYSRALGLADRKDIPRLKAKMAWAALADRQFMQAESLCQELIKLGFKTPVAWQGLGLARMGQGRLEEARQALQKATALDPRLWKAHNALGVIHDRQRHPLQAMAAFRRAIALQPRSPALHNNLGLAYLLAGRLEQAAASFRQALRLNPGYQLALGNLALTLARQGRWDEARRAFGDAWGKAAAHNNLGCLLSWSGDQARARRELEQALESSPRFYSLARRHLEQVRALAPLPPAELIPLPAAALPSLERIGSESPVSDRTGKGGEFGLIGVVSRERKPRLVEGLLIGADGSLRRSPDASTRLVLKKPSQAGAEAEGKDSR